MARYESVLDLIGNTPMVDITALSPNPRVAIVAKLEGWNPGGSVKDRAAKAMIEQAEKDGSLSPGQQIIESSSGNTGIALAMIAKVKGYPLKIVLPSHANARRKPLETYFTTNGVDIERVVEMDAMMGTLDLVSKSDWVTIIPALMMTAEIERMQFSVLPLVDPTAPLDLVVIEPMRRALSAAARAFLEILRAEAVNLNNLWHPFFD